MARAWIASVGALVVIAAAGCTDTVAWNVPLSQFHDLARASICRVRVLCGDFPDQATCEKYWTEPPHLYASLPQLVSAGRIAYDGDKARACLAIFDQTTGCSRQVLNAPDSLATCDAVLVGQVPTGAACFLNAECANGGTCQMTDTGCDPYAACCAGTCAGGGTPLAAGADCSSGQAPCGPGTTCVATSDGQTAICAPVAANFGDLCATSPCAGSLYCSSGAVCLRPVPQGGHCDPDLFGRDCDDLGNYCDRGTSLCTPLAPVGSPCNSIFTPCVGYATCDELTSVCLALPSAGQSCATGTGACLGSQACDLNSYTCVASSPGDSCY
ncbi:MAG TPA: hypothetical protein VMT03_21410 [Polyangia bacterium]|nr:hypothetical protein [Polyangia bacterium]